MIPWWGEDSLFFALKSQFYLLSHEMIQENFPFSAGGGRRYMEMISKYWWSIIPHVHCTTEYNPAVSTHVGTHWLHICLSSEIGWHSHWPDHQVRVVGGILRRRWDSVEVRTEDDLQGLVGCRQTITRTISSNVIDKVRSDHTTLAPPYTDVVKMCWGPSLTRKLQPDTNMLTRSSQLWLGI